MKKLLVSEQEIKEICARIGKEITDKFIGDENPPIIIGVLKGAAPFMMDLIKEIKCFVELDFVQYSSYQRTKSTGVVVMKKDISTDIKGRNVIIVEDIVDTGKTFAKMVEYLHTYEPLHIYTCTLLDKKARREVEFECDFVGKEIPNYFVYGYGLDYLEYFRNTKEIYYIDDEKIIIDELNNKKEWNY